VQCLRQQSAKRKERNLNCDGEKKADKANIAKEIKERAKKIDEKQIVKK
jgi:hypothetical protein